LYRFTDISAGQGGGAAALSLSPAILGPRSAPHFGDKLEQFRARAAELDLVVDLGVRIGSREWLRGLATCAALCYAGYAFAPGLQPFPDLSSPTFADAQWEEARTLSISPIAYGADTGRRMAATEAVVPLKDTPERPTLNVTARIASGDGFSGALRRAGVSSSDAEEVASLISGAVKAGEIKPGTTVDLILGRRPNRNVARPLDALAFRARFDLKLEVNRTDGRLVLTRIPIAVDNMPLRIQGRVGASLYRAARATGAPARAIETFIRAIAGQISIGSIDPDDRFDMILEHRRAATGETETGKLLYAGLDRSGGKDLQLMQWEQGGRAQWFEASGVGRQSGVLQRPVPGSVSSKFGMRRHPILGYSRMHKGMDFRAGYGTPILAATDGRVAAAGWAGGYGKQVRIRHAGGLMTSYSHMSRIVARPGGSVRQGQVIGYVGSTGLSTGPHLHYELYRNGRPVNPASVKFTMRAQLGGSDLSAFRSKLRNLLSVPVARAKSETRMAGAPDTAKPRS
jgi:murein DD-endopeptidase MepM/ murein hydrolase activator NlpD